MWMPFTKVGIIRRGHFGEWGGKEIESLVLAVNFECSDSSWKRCHVGIGKFRLKT